MTDIALYYNAFNDFFVGFQDFDLQRKDLIDIKNHLGIVFNVPKRSHINNNNNNNTYTILLNSGFAGKEGKVIHCISLMNISTFLREWNALHSISNYSLFPLTPYLLQASPAISASRLR